MNRGLDSLRLTLSNLLSRTHSHVLMDNLLQILLLLSVSVTVNVAVFAQSSSTIIGSELTAQAEQNTPSGRLPWPVWH